MVGVAGDGEGGVGDGEVEVFGHLVLSPRTFPTFRPIWSAPASRPAVTAAAIGARVGLGGGEQLAAFAGAFGGQGGLRQAMSRSPG